MRFFIYMIIVFLFGCMQPNKPKVFNIDLVMHLDTYGEALEVDLTDNKMVVAANYQGYIIYDINRNNQGNIIGLDSIANIYNMADDMGDNRAQAITISDNHGIAFITDIYDRIWLYKLDDDATQYQEGDDFLSDCYGGTWLSTAIDDQDDHINVFSLVQHSSSENDGEETIGNFDQYSTSVVWKKVRALDNTSEFCEDNAAPECEYSYNFGILARQINFDNGFLAISNGELGVKVLKQTNETICLNMNSKIEEFNIPVPDFSSNDDSFSSGIVDSLRNLCEVNFNYVDLPQFSNQESCEDFCICVEEDQDDGSQCIRYNCGYWVNNQNECIIIGDDSGFGGTFEAEGGFYPDIFSSFDLPGSVNSLLIKDSIIFTGLSTSNGCYMSLLGNNGQILNKLGIANGYTINNLSVDNGYLALSAGHDGVLLYRYYNQLDTEFIGQINTPYSNNVKIDGDNLIVSTEDGIFVYLIK